MSKVTYAFSILQPLKLYAADRVLSSETEFVSVKSLKAYLVLALMMCGGASAWANDGYTSGYHATGISNDTVYLNDLEDHTRIYYSSNPENVPTPTIDIVGNEVSFSCDESGVTFYYTTDGSTPTTNSTIWDNTITTIAGDATIKVFATKNGFNPSDVASKKKSTPSIVYIDGKNGNDSNDGYSYNNRVKTLSRAYNQLTGNTIDANVIVVCGECNPSGCFQCDAAKPCTFTGKYDGIDRGGVIRFYLVTGYYNNCAFTKGQTHNYVSADTRFQYLTFKDNNASFVYFQCRGYDVTFGLGLQMDLATIGVLPVDQGNLDGACVPGISILLTESNSAKPNESDWERTKPQVLTIKSGHYGRILGGRFTSTFFPRSDNTSHTILATKNNPVWAVINVEIDKTNVQTSAGRTFTYDINCICSGLTDGTMYGDIMINVKGGKLGYIIGANQGNAVTNGGSGSGIWPNSSFYGRAVVNVEQSNNLSDIYINNIFAGGLGRKSDSSSSICDMFVYGETEVNIKSGTIKQNVYGAGSGGVMGLTPWDKHIPYNTTENDNPTKAIFHGVKYGTTGSGTELASVSLHKLNDDHTGFASSGRDSLNLANSSTTINISGGSIGQNVYGGGYGYVDGGILPANIVPQGTGSLFGTSNINITGGNITENVYGGSRGATEYYGKRNNYGDTITHIAELNGTINMNITGTETKYPTIGGNIYGAGAGIPITTYGYTSNWARIATTGNTDLGAEYTTDINMTIDLPASHPFTGNIYGGGQSGMLDGNTTVNIQNGSIAQSVYGGGQGATAVMKGNSEVNMTGGTVGQNVFGGGDMAAVTGNTTINAAGGTAANIFGGGLGSTAIVRGNTKVSVSNGSVIKGDVFGGGNAADLKGGTNVKITGTTTKVDGSVFGGGNEANVSGPTYVQVGGQ